MLAADAACRAAALNVEINLGSIGDEELAKGAKSELDALVKKVGETSEAVMEKVKAALA